MRFLFDRRVRYSTLTGLASCALLCGPWGCGDDEMGSATSPSTDNAVTGDATSNLETTTGDETTTTMTMTGGGTPTTGGGTTTGGEASATDGGTTTTSSTSSASDSTSTGSSSSTGGDPLAVVVDFDDLMQNQMIPEIDSEYAVFSTAAESQCAILAIAEAFGSSPPNAISTTAGDGGDHLFIDFKTPAHDLKFLMLGINTVGVVAKIRVLYGANQMAEEPLVTDKAYGVIPFLVDLSAFPGITRIEVVEIDDLMGVGYDDFSFIVY